MGLDQSSIHPCPRFFKMKLEGTILPSLIRSCKDVTKSCWQAYTLNLHGESKQREITLGGRDGKELTWQIDRQVQSLRLLLAMVPIASYSLNC